MFSSHHGNEVLTLEATGIPTKQWQPPPPRVRPGTPPAPQPPVQQVPLLFFDATRDSRTGTLYVKAVNRTGKQVPVHIVLSGVKNIDATAQAITMAAASPEDTNSITEPEKIVPVTSRVNRAGPDFTRTLPPYSITVLQLKGR